MSAHFSLHKASRYFSRRSWLAIFTFTTLALLALPQHLRAVETSGAYETSETDLASAVSNWSSGWGASGITGWDYVGQVNGASAVYVGNGWVLTAAHVGAGTFVLGSGTYDVVAGSAQEVASGVDLTLFQIASAPDLPSLEIDTTSLTANNFVTNGSQVVMIGYGGGQESWGDNTVSAINQSTQVMVGSTTYTSNDFVTDYGAHGFVPTQYTNNSTFVVGDSGGGDFVNVSGTWELAGINEAVDSGSNSYMVQMSSYGEKVKQVTAVPEPSPLALLAISGFLLGILAAHRRVLG